jgi:uncharacterized RDD family membrane protein YckC
MDPNQILDEPSYQPEIVDPENHLAERWQRFVNFIVDLVGYYLLTAVFMIIYMLFYDIEDMSKGMSYLLTFLALFIYYFSLESYFGKTLGKLITRTKVVTDKGEEPSYTDILARTFCRIIPFDAFSYLGSDATGWHDTISKTRVIKTGRSANA